jgi:hypothetical protein
MRLWDGGAMDVAALTMFLAPALRFLLSVGEDAVEQARKSLGEETWDQARKLWARLRGKVEENSVARSATEQLAARPDDDEARFALTFFLRHLLAQDVDLAQELEAAWEEARSQTTAIASAERSAAVIGEGNITITGNVGAVHDIAAERSRDDP